MHLDIDERVFAEKFGVASYAVHHDLAEHELLTVEAIADLADRLPVERVEHNLGKLPVVLGAVEAPRVDQSPGEIARGIETNGCWMVLKNIESDPQYGRLIDECLDEIAPLLGSREGGMSCREGFIFLSAPGSVTPSHFDPEHNFLLQIRGQKSMHVGRFPDALTEQRELERYHHGGGRNIGWQPSEPHEYSLEPGDGVYVPVHMPHWVTVPDNVAVSLSITFFTRSTEDAIVLHKINGRLRKLGLKPAMPGRRGGVDQAKVLAGRALQSTAKRLRGTS
jgi:hypothetical protein